MPKIKLSDGAMAALQVFKQLRIDGRRHVVCWNEPRPQAIPPNALVTRFNIVSAAQIMAELFVPPRENPEQASTDHYYQVEGWLSELHTYGLIRTEDICPGLESPVTYARPDGKLVVMAYKSWPGTRENAHPNTHIMEYFVDGVRAGGYNIAHTYKMYELTPEGAAYVPPRRRGKMKPPKRPKRNEPTQRESMAMELYARRFTYEQIGDELGITKQRAAALVKSGFARTGPSGRSVKATRLPTDSRGQDTGTSSRGSGKRRTKQPPSQE